MLTDKEKEILSQIACDNETGHHLLYERSDDYKQMRRDWVIAYYAENPTEKQSEICEYVHQCSDYNYYMSLPQEKKLF